MRKQALPHIPGTSLCASIQARHRAGAKQKARQLVRCRAFGDRYRFFARFAFGFFGFAALFLLVAMWVLLLMANRAVSITASEVTKT